MREDKGLKRSIGVFGLSANIMNIMIGAGIFALPAFITGIMGPASIFSYIFCGILITLVVLCFAEAGSKVNNTGGPYTYIETAPILEIFGAHEYGENETIQFKKNRDEKKKRGLRNMSW